MLVFQNKKRRMEKAVLWCAEQWEGTHEEWSYFGESLVSCLIWLLYDATAALARWAGSYVKGMLGQCSWIWFYMVQFLGSTHHSLLQSFTLLAANSVAHLPSSWLVHLASDLSFLSRSISFLVRGPKVLWSASQVKLPWLAWLPGCLFQVLLCEEALSWFVSVVPVMLVPSWPK